MKKSLQLAAATGAALALLGPPAFAQGTAPGNAGANSSALGPERTDDAGAVGRQGAPTADRAAPDQEPGRGATGRTFAPESSPAARPPAADGVKPPAADVPRSPPTGDASGGDRRTAAPVTLAQALRNDRGLAGVYAYPHSIGAPVLRRVNDGGSGEGQAPTRRFHGANPPPEDSPRAPEAATEPPRSVSEPADTSRGASRDGASPPAGMPSNPPDARVTGEGAAPPSLSSSREQGRQEQ